MSRTDTAVRVISASLDWVFAALTDSNALAVWHRSTVTGRLEHFDARPGGSYRLVLAYADPSVAPASTSVSTTCPTGSTRQMTRRSRRSLPEPLSPMYPSRVREMSGRYRSHGVHYEPGPHTGTAHLPPILTCTSRLRSGGPAGPYPSDLHFLERTTGFEPATPTLARLCSTTEPRPRCAPTLARDQTGVLATRLMPSVQRPEWPNPPWPRSEGGSSSTTDSATCSTATITSWAIRSPLSTS